MLGRKKKTIQNISFTLDAAAGVTLMSLVYFFLKHYGRVWQDFLRAVTGYPFRIEGVSHLGGQSWLFLILLFSVLASLKLTRFYEEDLLAPFTRVVWASGKGILVGLAAAALFFYFFAIIEFNRSVLFGFAGIFFVYHIAKEAALRRYLTHKYFRRKPMQALLVSPARDIERRMRDFGRKEFGAVQVKGVVLTDGKQEDLPSGCLWEVLGLPERLPSLLSRGGWDVVFLGETSKLEIAQTVLMAAEEQGIEVWCFADFLSPMLARSHVDEYAGKPVIVFNTTGDYEARFLVKRVFDLSLSACLLVLLSPLLLGIAAAIKLTSRGPLFFVQRRTGFRGKPFRMIKFRTMRSNAEEERASLLDQNEMRGPVFKIRDDPRITPAGRFLRRYSLDELPQLLNVLKGEMSLVGPRPLPVEETRRFEAFRDFRRYSVLPGITGLWQVSGRSDIEDFASWVRLDLEYIDRWNLWLDIRILCRTLPAVLKGQGAR